MRALGQFFRGAAPVSVRLIMLKPPGGQIAIGIKIKTFITVWLYDSFVRHGLLGMALMA